MPSQPPDTASLPPDHRTAPPGEAEERLSRAQLGAGAGLWDWDMATGRLDWSPELFTLFGLDPARDTASFTTWQRIMHPDDTQAAGDRVQEAVANHTTLDNVYRVVLPDGGVRWIQALGNTTYDDAGTPLKMAGLCIDVTARREAEISLAAADTFARQVIDSAREGIIVYGPDLTYRVWNPFMEELTGLTADQVIGRHPAEVFPGLVAVGVIERVELALAGGLPEAIEVPIVVPGRTGWAVDRSGPLRDENGEIIGVIATVQDVTSRRQAEDSAEAFARLMTESQRAARLGSYRADFVVGRWESSAVLDEIFGIGPDYDRSIPGWQELIHPDDRAEGARYLTEEVIGKGRPFDWEYRITRASDGEVRWVHGLGEVTRAPDGTAIALAGTIADITDRHIAAEERERLATQLRQAERMEAIGRLAGGIAHDFNNMLGAILGYTELALERTGDDAELHEDLREIRRAAMRSAELTRQLLAYARRETTSPRVIDINATVEANLGMLRRLLSEDIHLEWRATAEPAWVRIDPTQIDRVLTNLCVNARDAVEDAGGRIIVEAGRVTISSGSACLGRPGCEPGDYVTLSVTDDGRGMDAATIANVFEPFFTTKGPGEGTGLGLAMVHGIVTGAGGFIDVTSSPGRGSTFRIHLPLHTGGPDVVVHPAVDAVPSAPAATVLLVEDEPALLAMTGRMLRHLGYRVLAAASPAAAIELCEADPNAIDVLLTDVVMPGMNGRDLVTRLRALRPDLPCVFMSGYPAESIGHGGAMPEGAGFIAKPFSVGELEAGVRAALQRE